MHDWTLLPESLEELRLTFEGNESPLEKWPGNLVGQVAHGSLSTKGTEVAFWKDGKM